MKKTILFLTFNCLLTAVSAQSIAERNNVIVTITTLFKGLHNGDSTLVSSVLHPNIKIQTTGNNRAGKSFLKNETKMQFLKGIASKKANDTYLEKLLTITVKIDGNLASVWTPYEFYYNEKFSHCGANSFQLYKNNGKWKIIYLVDMRRTTGCKPLKK